MSAIPYKLIRSKRKTLALSIDSDARLVVKAPIQLSDDFIADFVHKKRRWVFEKQREVECYGTKQSMFVLEDGESILLRGDSYMVQRRDVPMISIDNRCIIIPQDMTIESFAIWMKAHGESVIKERVDYYANMMGVKYAAVRMSDAKHRWGSCGVGNSLNFAWRLVMCPLLAIDYVVIHELSHILYKDHGEKFWARVMTVMPNYKDAQDWLRLNRKLMEVI